MYKIKARGVDEMAHKECTPAEVGQGENIGNTKKLKIFQTNVFCLEHCSQRAIHD